MPSPTSSPCSATGAASPTAPLAGTSNEALVAHMVGRSVDQLFPERHQRAPGDVVLDVRDLVAPPVVKQASFTLRRGEILGLAGLMGSGRSEMVRGLFGLAPVASGAVRIAGADTLIHARRRPESVSASAT